MYNKLNQYFNVMILIMPELLRIQEYEMRDCCL